MIMNTIIFDLYCVVIDCNSEYFFLKKFRGDRVDNFEAEVTVDLEGIYFSNHTILQKELLKLKIET